MQEDESPEPEDGFCIFTGNCLCRVTEMLPLQPLVWLCGARPILWLQHLAQRGGMVQTWASRHFLHPSPGGEKIWAVFPSVGSVTRGGRVLQPSGEEEADNFMSIPPTTSQAWFACPAPGRQKLAWPEVPACIALLGARGDLTTVLCPQSAKTLCSARPGRTHSQSPTSALCPPGTWPTIF